ncbi:hypothetical protein JKL49_08860 [Phenylobacterium sp. 20VBR1]|uniref:HMW1C N-terminal domain-containing protein n=2 Tax=Phenylobacterium glaciei TaxID=2803784 RepID=A0A941CZE7_9CAUL|nr:hypothetical protein [Phenylobacterium glaciei]MBR7619495.1 hypothetical protein [Phenylobacterium glaciei]
MLDVSELEAACYARTGDRVVAVLRILEGLITARELSDPDQIRGYTRLAAAVGAVLADPAVQPTPDEMASLIFAQGPMSNLFRASAFGGSDHLRALLSDQLLSLLSIDSESPMDIGERLEKAGPLALLVALTAVATVPLLTAQGEERREDALARIAAGDLGQIPAKLSSLSLASNGWMLCSYAFDAEKHDIKQVLNRAFRDLLVRLSMSAAPLSPRAPLKDRPTLVFCAEVIHSTHVQYRYYGQYLRQLRTRFRLVLIAPELHADPAVRSLFDEVVVFTETPKGEHLNVILAAIKRAQPDILFWPSLGMSHWGPLIGNLRLAPIQVVAIGHPASTFIPEIDYMILEEGFVDEPEVFSERLILLPDEALRLEPSPSYRPVRPNLRPTADPVRIALPCNMIKLNPTFVALLARLRERAASGGRVIEYHVFPNASALQVAAFKAVNDLRLGDPIIHGKMSPNAYLERLNDCDIALSPYPFGGFHSVIDCLRQGLPVVAMDAPGNPVKTDRMLLRLLGMPAWLVATTEAAYEEAALRIVMDDDLRVELGEQALAARIDEQLFAVGDRPIRSEVADAMWALYQHHEAIQANPARVFTSRELAAL